MALEARVWSFLNHILVKNVNLVIKTVLKLTTQLSLLEFLRLNLGPLLFLQCINDLPLVLNNSFVIMCADRLHCIHLIVMFLIYLMTFLMTLHKNIPDDIKTSINGTQIKRSSTLNQRV